MIIRIYKKKFKSQLSVKYRVYLRTLQKYIERICFKYCQINQYMTMLLVPALKIITSSNNFKLRLFFCEYRRRKSIIFSFYV